MNAANRLAPWLAAAAGALAVGWLFWPGYLSWDSSFQWWQARHGTFDGVHPPLMAMLWGVVDGVVPGPGSFFAVQLAAIWSALAAFAATRAWPWPARVALVAVLGLWPPLLGLQAHLWKDLWTLAGFAWAVAWLASDLRRPSRTLRIAALLALAAACGFRHNAITGALPLLAWIAMRETGPGRHRAAALLTLLLAAATWGLAQLPQFDARVKPVDRIWSVVVLWDAAAVSLAEQRLVYPPELVDPTLSLDDLRAHYADYTNTTVYGSGKLLHSFDRAYTPAQKAALDRLAWTLPLRHGRAYFGHRARLAELMLGLDPAGLPDGQVLMPGIHPYGDNPAVIEARPRLHDLTLDWLRARIDTPLFAGWVYLLTSVVVVLLAMLRRGQGGSGLAAMVAASAIAYTLPLFLASGSAEFRYLAWPLLATGLGLALLLPVRAEARPAP